MVGSNSDRPSLVHPVNAKHNSHFSRGRSQGRNGQDHDRRIKKLFASGTRASFKYSMIILMNTDGRAYRATLSLGSQTKSVNQRPTPTPTQLGHKKYALCGRRGLASCQWKIPVWPQ